MELSKYSTKDKKNWDNLVINSKNGIFLFERNYMDYHCDRFIDHSLIFTKKNKIVAAFPANEKGDEIISHGGLTFGSLIMSKRLRTIEVLEIFDKMKIYYSDLGFKKIIYKPTPSIFHKYPAEEDLYALFKLDAQISRRDISSVININSKLTFSQTKRQAIAKCISKNVKCVENTNFTEFWDLLEKVLLKFDAKPVHTLEEITLLHNAFPEKIRLFEARSGDALLAGVVIYDFGQTVHTQYMANSQEGRCIGALDFINNDLLKNVFNDKSHYSFGISTELQGIKLNKGLIQQKEMMGGRAIVLDFYTVVL